MSQRDDIRTVAQAVRAELRGLLPRRQARAAQAELGALLARDARGEDVTVALLEALSRRDATREAALRVLGGERGPGYQALLTVVTSQTGAQYACPVVDCKETAYRLDDSEAEPRCTPHNVVMYRC